MANTAIAQIVLPPKPESKHSSTKENSEEILAYRTMISSIPAKGWHIETSAGMAIWGRESQCQCNALTADVSLVYLNRTGLLLGTQFTFTNTVSPSLTPGLKIGYQHINKPNGSIGVWSVNLFAGPSIGNIRNQRFNFTEKYQGLLYGGELGFQPRLGKYSELRAIIALGWLTQRETFISERNWTGAPTETKMTHSGLRFRIGITI